MSPRIGKKEAIDKLGLEHTYVLSSNTEAPVVLLVHGRAGSYRSMWTFRRCIPEGCHAFAVQAPYDDDQGGFTWWDILRDDAREKGLEAVKLLKNFLEQLPEAYQITPTRTVALGFSQGSGVLSLMVQRDPKRLAGLGILAGFVIPDKPPPDLSKSILPEVLIAHGIADEHVPISKAKRSNEYLESLGFKTEFIEDDVGHKVGVNGMRRLKEWLIEVLLEN